MTPLKANMHFFKVLSINGALTILTIAVLMMIQAPQDTYAAGSKDKTPETKLGEAMERMNKDFRTLRRQVRNASKNAHSLELITAIHSSSDESLKEVPLKAADLPESERAEFIAEYRRELEIFIAVVDRIKTALLANDNAAAEKGVAELATLQKRGHDSYRKKKDGEKDEDKD